jgi:hypothetical protein
MLEGQQHKERLFDFYRTPGFICSLNRLKRKESALYIEAVRTAQRTRPMQGQFLNVV